MSFFKRLLGICSTQLPVNNDCYTLCDGTLDVDLDRSPELGDVGGAVRLECEALPVRVLVVHAENDTYFAFQNKCTHGGRRLDHKADSQTVQCCSVGKSTFDYSGELKSGSAKRAIKTFPVDVEGRHLRIQLDHP